MSRSWSQQTGQREVGPRVLYKPSETKPITIDFKNKKFFAQVLGDEPKDSAFNDVFHSLELYRDFSAEQQLLKRRLEAMERELNQLDDKDKFLYEEIQDSLNFIQKQEKRVAERMKFLSKSIQCVITNKR
jgi:hypothetical protein